jgi:predicted MPP superfamily phosphohydrolase
MPFTLMHISDLHRPATDPISNTELLSALVADRERARREDPAVAAPDAIIVTGDLVQGARLGEAEYEAKLDSQYEVAAELLVRLAEEFLDGDRARLVMVAGNHDVDWNCALTAMEPVPDEELEPGFSTAICGPNDLLRWSWPERRAYRIVDLARYERRLARFDDLVSQFYAGTDVTIDPLYRMHTLLDERIAVVAFSSLVGNDCFAFHGAIAQDALGKAHLALEHAPYELRVAAWHHSVEGEPAAGDYMSVSTVHRLIGKGFRLGLHGHQHQAGVQSRYVYLPEEEKMAVVSAGSLCAGVRGLPIGVNRQYNLIEIAEDLCSARVHVREVAAATNFAPARRPDMGFATFAKLSWTLPISSEQRDESVTLEAERALAEGHYSEAERLLRRLTRAPGGYARSLMVATLTQQSAWDRLADELTEPHTIAELVAGTGALAKSGAHEQAERYLEAHHARLAAPAPAVRELEALIAAARELA